MNRPLRAMLALCLLAVGPALTASNARAESKPLRVMTFNIRLPIAQDGANAWDVRRDFAADVVAAASPDLIATQELHKVQGDFLLSRLPGFAWFGIDRRGGHADEHMGVFYRHDRLWLAEHGNFWLSDTPEIPGSISWGHPFPRMVTWALFEDRADRRRFYLLNTHLPYRAEDGEARRRGAQQILRYIESLPADLPVILAGDFNATPDSDVHRLLSGYLADVWLTAPRREGPAETFHAFSGKADRRIDWILARGFTVLSAATVAVSRNERYPSDHYPVVADLVAASGR